MPQYRVAEAVKSERLNEAARVRHTAAAGGEPACRQLRAGLVLFATSLFFAGISTKVRTLRPAGGAPRARLGVLLRHGRLDSDLPGEVLDLGAGLGQAIGNILPFAVVVAISPIPMIAMVLMLATPRARANGPAFALGWIAGLSVLGAIVLVLTTGNATQDSRGARDLGQRPHARFRSGLPRARRANMARTPEGRPGGGDAQVDGNGGRVHRGSFRSAPASSLSALNPKNSS